MSRSLKIFVPGMLFSSSSREASRAVKNSFTALDILPTKLHKSNQIVYRAGEPLVIGDVGREK